MPKSISFLLLSVIEACCTGLHLPTLLLPPRSSPRVLLVAEVSMLPLLGRGTKQTDGVEVPPRPLPRSRGGHH